MVCVNWLPLCLIWHPAAGMRVASVQRSSAGVTVMDESGKTAQVGSYFMVTGQAQEAVSCGRCCHYCWRY